MLLLVLYLNELNIFQCQVCTKHSSVDSRERMWSSSLNKYVVLHFASQSLSCPSNFRNHLGMVTQEAELWLWCNSTNARPAVFTASCCKYRFSLMECWLLWWIGCKPAWSEAKVTLHGASGTFLTCRKEFLSYEIKKGLHGVNGSQETRRPPLLQIKHLCTWQKSQPQVL